MNKSAAPHDEFAVTLQQICILTLKILPSTTEANSSHEHLVSITRLVIVHLRLALFSTSLYNIDTRVCL